MADTLLTDAWDRDLKLAWVLLIATMNTRWARGGLTSDEASCPLLSMDEVSAITGRRRRDVALTLLQRLADVAPMTVELCGDYVQINAPKVAEFQQWGPGTRASPARKLPPTPTPPPPQHSPEESEGAKPTPIETGDYRLLNLIARYDGAEDEKRAWLDHELPVIEAEVADGNGTLRSLVTRYYRAYLNQDIRKYRDWSRKQSLAEAKRRWDEEHLADMQAFEAEQGSDAAYR